ncbi:uncharacterized protein LOC126842643 isoform X1 [Adelges cooleyi]|uniref:uncharacterized protein LOC126842643 isoform X1 n=1 Tax=Adelges cooleyi TaxID=133065 RepID=UPI00217FD1BC|nr:uncharacterized protein LOC126842643 isoform X1 [Adelges cooleyi]
MQHLKLLTVIVLSLAVQICRSMPDRSKQYTASAVDNPTMFRCHCLLKALTHMRVTRMSFRLREEPVVSILDIVVDSDASEALSILYSSYGVEIGSLWQFHLYTGLLRSYYLEDLKKKDGEGTSYDAAPNKNISEIHGYVTELLVSDWDATDCKKYTINDWFWPFFKETREAVMPQIKERVEKNNQEFRNLVEAKKGLLNTYMKQLTKELSESLSIKNLLLNELGNITVYKNSLMNSYNVDFHVDPTFKFDWVDFDDILKSSFNLAIKVTWPEDHLQNLKSYFTKHINFLEIIFFRITLVHLLVIEKLEAGPMKHYARKWHTLLTYFGQMLHIADDTAIQHLLTAFDQLANPGQKVGVGAVIYDLENILHSCVLSLKPNAVKPKAFNQETIKSGLQTATSSGHGLEELITQKKANQFLEDLKLLILKKTNFSVIRSLAEYIDEHYKIVSKKGLEVEFS